MTATLHDLLSEINAGNDPFGPCKFDDLKATPLHYASKYGSLELVLSDKRAQASVFI